MLALVATEAPACSNTFAVHHVAQVLAEYIQPRDLAGLACCGSSCHAAYQPIAQQARVKQLWQKARLVLYMPALRWVQHFQPKTMTTDGGPGNVIARVISRSWLDVLVATLTIDRQILRKEFQAHCFEQCVSISWWVERLMSRPGCLTEQDRYFLQALLKDSAQHVESNNGWGSMNPWCRHSTQQPTEDVCLVQIMPVWLILLLAASDSIVAALRMGFLCNRNSLF